MDGIATFEGLRVDANASGFTLEAFTGDVVSAPSAAFNVTAVQGIAGVATLDAAVQSVGEDVGTVDVAVSIDLAQTHDIVLTYEVSGDAANLADSDVSEDRFFNITIPAGQVSATRSLTIIDDAEAEPSETIVLRLANAAMADEAGAITEQTITIIDND